MNIGKIVCNPWATATQLVMQFNWLFVFWKILYLLIFWEDLFTSIFAKLPFWANIIFFFAKKVRLLIITYLKEVFYMPRRNYKTLRLAVVAVKSFQGNGHVLNKLESKIPNIAFYISEISWTKWMSCYFF